jgi:two-component system cell cycle response regulator DivK
VQKKILVVEDGEFNRDLLVQLLADEYTVVLAADGLEGLCKAELEKPDLILMDLGLPGMDGWEATRRIKASPALSRIPVVAITSHAMVGDETKARAAGCDEYLAKPIDEDVLLKTIRKLV